MRTVALLSGGIDSTVMLWKLLKEGHKIIPLTILTYRRNPREVEAVERIAAYATKEPLRIYDLSFLTEIYDFPPIFKEQVYRINPELPNIVIPYRNIIFYAVAAHIALLTEAENVAGGHTAEDVERIPDAAPEFFHDLERILMKSFPYRNLKILTPLTGLSKVEVVRLGMELEAPLHLTWSCWSTKEKHCGECPGCLRRHLTFREVGYSDKTDYLKKPFY